MLKVPDAALRYKPPMSPEEARALYQRYGIEGGPVGHAPAGFEVNRPAGHSDRSRHGSPGDHSAAPAADSSPETAIVWKREASGAIRPVEIALGITDHAFTAVTAVLKGELKVGDELITRDVTTKSNSPVGQGIR